MITKLNNNEGVKLSQSTAGQRELIREMRNKINELVHAINDHEDLLYGCDNDEEDDGWAKQPANAFPGVRAITDHLEDLSDLELKLVRSKVAEEIERRNDEDDICPDCRFDALFDGLDDLNEEQLQIVRSEANRLLEERVQEEMMESITTKGSRS